MLKLTSAPFIATLVLASSAFSQQLDASKYPKADVIAEARDEWTKAIASSVPGLAPRKPDSPSDWSKDVTRCKSDSDWGLSFDDGPSQYTENVVNAMKEKGGVKGTFFVVGSRILTHPEALKKAYEEGHQIALHTWSHPYLTTLPTGQIIAEIVYNAMAVKEIIGVTPKALRPPYGDVDDRVRAICKALGIDIVIWNSDVNDFQFSDAKEDNKTALDSIVNRLRAEVKGPKKGGISLEHDLYAIPSKAGIEAVSVITQAGYKIKSVSECTGLNSYSDNIWSALKIPAPQTNGNSSTSNATASVTATASATATAAVTTSVATASATASITPAATPSNKVSSASTHVTLISTASIGLLCAWLTTLAL